MKRGVRALLVVTEMQSQDCKCNGLNSGVQLQGLMDQLSPLQMTPTLTLVYTDFGSAHKCWFLVVVPQFMTFLRQVKTRVVHRWAPKLLLTRVSGIHQLDTCEHDVTHSTGVSHQKCVCM